jgi:hypothetical protein
MSQIDVTHAQHAPCTADLLIVTGCVTAVASVWQALTSWLVDDYKPEKHYMRGPGPKWCEKHGFAEIKCREPSHDLMARNADRRISIP